MPDVSTGTVLALRSAFAEVPAAKNPQGVPSGFATCPAFTLQNKKYGFEFDFTSEVSAARLAALSVSFNRVSGQKHQKIYGDTLADFMRRRGYASQGSGEDANVSRTFENFTQQDCIDFANEMTPELIIAFDFEPGQGWRGIVNSSAGGFLQRMTWVIDRLRQRGILAYDWLTSVMQLRFSDQPGRFLDLVNGLGSNLDNGTEPENNTNNVFNKYLRAFERPDLVQVSGYAPDICRQGVGYSNFMYSMVAGDPVDAANSSPYVNYFKPLILCDLTRKYYPSVEQVIFVWFSIEYYNGTFANNHVVKLGNGKVRKLNNRAMYHAQNYSDCLLLLMLRCKYLFYWSPGQVRANPQYAMRYAVPNLQPNDELSWVYEGPDAAPPSIGDGFYLGKENAGINALIDAAQRYSQVQSICDNAAIFQVALTYVRQVRNRANKSISTNLPVSVAARADGGQYVHSLINRTMFVLVLKNNSTNERAFFAQDLFCHPSLSTSFSFTFEGVVYDKMSSTVGGVSQPLKTKGNRLLFGKF